MTMRIKIEISETVDGYRVDMWEGDSAIKLNPLRLKEVFELVHKFLKEQEAWYEAEM